MKCVVCNDNQGMSCVPCVVYVWNVLQCVSLAKKLIELGVLCAFGSVAGGSNKTWFVRHEIAPHGQWLYGKCHVQLSVM